MPDKTWKRFERSVAKILGGVRHPVTGERAGADVETGRLVVQAKKGYKMNQCMRRWLESITGFRDDKAQGKTPIVVWQTKGQQDTEAVVYLTLGEFVRLIGKEDYHGR